MDGHLITIFFEYSWSENLNLIFTINFFLFFSILLFWNDITSLFFFGLMSHSISSPIHMPILSTWNSFGKLIAFYILIESGGFLNTSYLTDSYIVFTLKMESVPKIKNFGLKMLVKSGQEKIFLKFLHAEAIFF